MNNSKDKMTRSEKATKKASNAKRKKLFLIIGTVALAVCLLLGLGGFVFYNHLMENRTIQANISVAGVPVQGMTGKEASEAITEAFLLSHRGKQMVVKIGGETITLTADVTNVHLDTDELIKDALKISSEYPQTEAFPFTEYIRIDKEAVMPLLRAVTDKLESTLVQSSYAVSGKAPEKYDVIDESCNQQIVIQLGTPGISIDPENIFTAITQAYAEGSFSFEYTFPSVEPDALNLEEIFKEHCLAATDAALDPETFQITPSCYGYGFDIQAVTEALGKATAGEALTFDFIWLEPAVTVEALHESMFCDVLGEYKTTAGWSSSRNTNLRLSSQAINGTILMPGETFSFNKTVGERTVEKGYGEGAGYIGGEVVPTIGGGICQVASTLYFACVLSDLKIVERHVHAYFPSYMPNSTDATVAWGALDYRFKNDSDRPIKLEVTASGSTVKVRILGVDTRDYYVKFESKTIRKIPFDTVYVEYPPDNPEGYTDGQVISKSSPCDGYESKTYRNKYDKETGKLISSKLENHDTYATRKKIVVKIVDPNPPVTPDTTPGASPEITPVPSPDNTPDNTPAPSPDNTPGNTPAPSPDNTPGNTPAPSPDNTPGNTPAASPDNTPGNTTDTPPSGGNSGITEDGN